jgi:hypothetical protein
LRKNNSEGAAAISYVVPTDTWASVRDPVVALAAQSEAATIELVLVAPDAAQLGPASQSSASLHSVRVVECPGDDPGFARREGIAAASGDLVAIGETHVAPAPDWAARVLGAHAQGADVVIPQMRNGNPHTALSWVAFLMDYGRYTGGGHRTRRLPVVPMYNASFRRSVILDLGDPSTLLSPGTAMDEAVRRAGATVIVEPKATIDHLNIDRPLHWLRERYLGGRLTAAGRRRSWSRARRLAYAAASPLIAVVLFTRIVRIPRTEAPRGTTGALALGCAVWAFGEAVGYVGKRGNTDRRMLEYETHKRAYVRQRK